MRWGFKFCYLHLIEPLNQPYRISANPLTWPIDWCNANESWENQFPASDGDDEKQKYRKFKLNSM